MWLSINHLSSLDSSFFVYKLWSWTRSAFSKNAFYGKIHSMKCSAGKRVLKANVWETPESGTLRIQENSNTKPSLFNSMFSNHIWQQFLLQYLLRFSCDFSPFQLASLWIVCIFSSPHLSPFLHLKHSFPTPQCFKILPQRLAQTLANSPMNCSLVPSVGDSLPSYMDHLKYQQ